MHSNCCGSKDFLQMGVLGRVAQLLTVTKWKKNDATGATKRKKNDASTTGASPTTESLHEAIIKSAVFKGNNATEAPIFKFILKHNKGLESGWVRKLIPGTSYPRKYLSETEEKVLGYIHTVFWTARIKNSMDEMIAAFGATENMIRKIAKVYSVAVVPIQLQSPSVQVIKRARHGPTPAQISVEAEMVEVNNTDSAELEVNQAAVECPIPRNLFAEAQHTTGTTMHMKSKDSARQPVDR
jgi:hypothetical protein